MVARGGAEAALRFADPAEELQAATRAAGLVDHSWRGRLHLTGGGRLDYLHRITAQAFHDLVPPGGVRAAVLERTGKIVEVVTAHAFPDHLSLLTSAANRERAREWLARFVFRDDVQVEDVTGATGQLLLLGPGAAAVAVALAGSEAADLDLHAWLALPDPPGGILIRTLADAWSLVARAAEMPALWETTLAVGREAGLRPVGEEAWQAVRVLAGIPEGGAEVDARANPLELGLDDSVSLTKGCFTGQEALAKMVTHDAVKRRLVGLELGAGPVPAPGTPVRAGDAAVGRVTSATEVPGTDRRVALALVGRDHAEPGVRLRCGDSALDGRVTPLPFPALD